MLLLQLLKQPTILQLVIPMLRHQLHRKGSGRHSEQCSNSTRQSGRIVRQRYVEEERLGSEPESRHLPHQRIELESTAGYDGVLLNRRGFRQPLLSWGRWIQANTDSVTAATVSTVRLRPVVGRSFHNANQPTFVGRPINIHG